MSIWWPGMIVCSESDISISPVYMVYMVEHIVQKWMEKGKMHENIEPKDVHQLQIMHNVFWNVTGEEKM